MSDRPIVVAAGGRQLEPTLRTAALMAQHLGRRVKAVSVLHGETTAERASALARLLDDTLARVFGARPDWDVHVVPGDPARMIAEHARAAGAALIVTGIGRPHPIDRLLGAETALAIVRVASCPVLAVTHELRKPPRSVVIATDFSATSASAVQSVLPLLDRAPTLTFVHVWTPSSHESGMERDERYRSQLPARFCRFIATLELPSSVSVRQEILEGHTAERVLDLAEMVDADLVVLGRHGRGSVERLVVGSVATRVLRGTTRAVFVVPEVAVTVERGPMVIPANRSEWPAMLEAFTLRNAGRTSRISVCETAMEAFAEERGYRFVRIGYDEGTGEVEIILGEASGLRHVRRVMRDVSAIAPQGEDGLRLAQSNGETVLGFLDEPALV